MTDPWVWRQPTDQADLLARLADARDLDVPERERENLCACAHTEITRLLGQADTCKTLRASYLEDIRSGDWALAARGAEIERLWRLYEASEAVVSRLTAELSARHTIESWQREVGGREADIDRLRALLVQWVFVFDGQTEPLHPLSWQTELEATKRELAREEQT